MNTSLNGQPTSPLFDRILTVLFVIGGILTLLMVWGWR